MSYKAYHSNVYFLLDSNRNENIDPHSKFSSDGGICCSVTLYALNCYIIHADFQVI